MIFNEIYSAYYNSVAKIITAILNGKTDEQSLRQIVFDNAFGESLLTVLPSLKSQKWQLVRGDLTTPIVHTPTMPMTLLQKQWLKAISLDPRFQLFNIELKGLENIDPLFTPDDYFVYDKYGDGDPYEDEGYIKRFQTVLQAVNEKHPLKIQMLNRRGNTVSTMLMPQRLEYSEKDDKFRLISTGCRYAGTVNLARITACEICPQAKYREHREVFPEKDCVTLRITDERNTLERCLLHFAHFEKQAERLDKKHYLVKIKCTKTDETEMVIRILGFGPNVEVTEPQEFRNLIIDRLKRQKECNLL